MVQMRSLTRDLRCPAAGEHFDEILRLRNVVIERIESSAQVESRLYDQEQDEWILLLQGKARLDLGGEEVDLAAGDCLLIPSRLPHRVLETSADPTCVWLAVHIY